MTGMMMMMMMITMFCWFLHFTVVELLTKRDDAWLLSAFFTL